MKTRSLLLLILALFSLSSGLFSAQEKAKPQRRYFAGFQGGFSFLRDGSVDQAIYPGVYPNRIVIGLFAQTEFSIYEDDAWPNCSTQIELFYLDQASTHDVVVRDDLGNIVETYAQRYSRRYLELDNLINVRIMGLRRVVPVISAGPAVALRLKTTRRPAEGEPDQPSFKSFVFSLVFGVGLEYRLGRKLLCLNARYDVGFDSLKWSRRDAKPDSLMILAGIGF